MAAAGHGNCCCSSMSTLKPFVPHNNRKTLLLHLLLSSFIDEIHFATLLKTLPHNCCGKELLNSWLMVRLDIHYISFATWHAAPMCVDAHTLTCAHNTYQHAGLWSALRLLLWIMYEVFQAQHQCWIRIQCLHTVRSQRPLPVTIWSIIIYRTMSHIIALTAVKTPHRHIATHAHTTDRAKSYSYIYIYIHLLSRTNTSVATNKQPINAVLKPCQWLFRYCSS